MKSVSKITLKNCTQSERIYTDMKLQFPKSERKDFECFEKLLNDSSYKIFTVCDQEAEAGYIVVFIDEKNKTLWLDYIAIYKQFHSKGYGSAVFSAMREEFSGYKGVWLEVEKPSDSIPDTLRRIKFYKRLGAKKLECEYFYPNKEGDLPMDLYFMPFDSDKKYFPDCDCALSSIKNVFKFLHCEIPHAGEILDKIKLK